MTAYSDGVTPNVTNSVDRLGRVIQVSGFSSQISSSFNLAGFPLSESYTGGTLDGLSVTNAYDTNLRRTSLTLLSSLSPLLSSAYGYGTDGRLFGVTNGAFSVAYSYIANSPLVSQITFRSNSVTRMTTTKQYDFLNRLLSISCCLK